MAKFNTAQTRTRVNSPLTTERTASGTTHEGHPGYARDVRSELFLLAVSNFVGEDTFYEKAADRDNRYVALVRQATLEFPEWTADFLKWLRADGNMRSAAIVGAAEYAQARREAKLPGVRKVVDSVLLRADEPGEFVAYWYATHGKTFGGGVQRGVGDALLRLGTESNYLKYGEGKGYTWDRLLNLCHPGEGNTGTPGRKHGRSNQKIRGPWQHDLFAHIIKSRYEKGVEIPEALGTLTRRQALMKLPVDERRAALEPLRLKEAGMTWEALAGWLQGPMDAEAWSAIIPNMGIMALIRNLRNFDEAGVSDEVAKQVAVRIADPEQVARSRQLPYRWLSAYQNSHNDRWKVPLGMALDAAVLNIPKLTGRTLILVDTSASMSNMGYSARSKMTPVQAAALFGVALAQKCGPGNVDLYGYADGVFQHPVRGGASVLNEVANFSRRIGEVGHGTQTAAALRTTYSGHDRVVILTDEQAFAGGWHGNVSDQVPANIPIYAFNLQGYEKGMLPGEGNRHQLGGLTDHVFKMIPMLEAGRNGTWPWQQR
jgi:hypothetical protein